MFYTLLYLVKNAKRINKLGQLNQVALTDTKQIFENTQKAIAALSGNEHTK